MSSEITSYSMLMDIDKEKFYEYEKAFCDRLRFLRNAKGISAREMSIALGQNVNYINLIENGKRLPSLQGFFSICTYLSISPEDFFGETNEKGWGAKHMPGIFARLNRDQLFAMAQMARAFIGE